MDVRVHRGLILMEPYGSYVRNNTKTIILKTKHFKQIINVPLLLIENKMGLGVIVLDEPQLINLNKFKLMRKYHLITESDRLKWWESYEELYAYSIIKKHFFQIPILLGY